MSMFGQYQAYTLVVPVNYGACLATPRLYIHTTTKPRHPCTCRCVYFTMWIVREPMQSLFRWWVWPGNKPNIHHVDLLLAVTNLSFVSSKAGIPFATNDGALTLTRCESATRCVCALATLLMLHASVSELPIYM